MENESLAQEYVENLQELLSSNSSNLSFSEILDEVVILLNDYREDAKIEEEQIINQNILNNSNDENVVVSPSVVLNKSINRGFILEKATKNYYKIHNLNEETFELLSPVEKTKHRKGITTLFNTLLLEENNKPNKISNLTAKPFQTKIKRNTSEDKTDENDIAKGWYNEQISALKQKIRFCTAEKQELERQNKIEKISGYIITRNEDRIAELNKEIEQYESNITTYQVKL
jgi:hypothetical protein